VLVSILWALGLKGAAIAVVMGGASPETVYYGTLIQAACALHGVPTAIGVSVAYEESRFKPGVVSSKGARGLMQVIPGHNRVWCSPLTRHFKLNVGNLLVNVYEGCWRLADFRRQKGKNYLCHYASGWTCKPKGERYQRRVEARARRAMRQIERRSPWAMYRVSWKP
jgi:hypothetical protein